MELVTGTTINRPDLGTVQLGTIMQKVIDKSMGLKIAPLTGVPTDIGEVTTIPLFTMIRDEDVLRANDGSYNRSTSKFGKFSWKTIERGHEEVLDSRRLKQYKRLFDAEQVVTLIAMIIMFLQQEKRIANKFFAPATYTGILAGSGDMTADVDHGWVNPTTATPIDDVLDAIGLIEDQGGDANFVGLTKKDMRLAMRTDQVIEQGLRPASMLRAPLAEQLQFLADLWQVPEVFITSSRYNTDPGSATDTPTYASMWSDDRVLIGQKAETNLLEEECLGRTLLWEEDSLQDASGNFTVEQYPSNRVRANVYRARHDTEEKAINPAFGYLLTGISTVDTP